MTAYLDCWAPFSFVMPAFAQVRPTAAGKPGGMSGAHLSRGLTELQGPGVHAGLQSSRPMGGKSSVMLQYFQNIRRCDLASVTCDLPPQLQVVMLWSQLG